MTIPVQNLFFAKTYFAGFTSCSKIKRVLMISTQELSVIPNVYIANGIYDNLNWYLCSIRTVQSELYELSNGLFYYTLRCFNEDHNYFSGNYITLASSLNFTFVNVYVLGDSYQTESFSFLHSKLLKNHNNTEVCDTLTNCLDLCKSLANCTGISQRMNENYLHFNKILYQDMENNNSSSLFFKNCIFHENNKC